MRIVIEGDAAPGGWPAGDCRCASCAGLRRAGSARVPTRILLDGRDLLECSCWEVPGGLDVRAPGGERVLYASGPGRFPEPVAGTVYAAVFLDLLADPSYLAALRRAGAVGPETAVHAVHLDHRVPSEAELDRWLGLWRAPVTGPYRTLLLGGSRSGKSAEAELRLSAHPDVTYVATGPVPDGSDDAWTARVEGHRKRRPGWWQTRETHDLAAALREAPGAVLADGLGTWLAAVMDVSGGWDDPEAVRPWFGGLVKAWREVKGPVVAVTDEVGMSLVPTTASGRLFRDLLGELNQTLAAESEEVCLVVAGRLFPAR